jgi:hypothetical protein
MGHTRIKRLGRRTRQCPPTLVDDRTRDHHRDPLVLSFFKNGLHCEDRSFGIEGIEDSFDQDDVNFTFEESLCLLGVRDDELVE